MYCFGSCLIIIVHINQNITTRGNTQISREPSVYSDHDQLIRLSIFYFTHWFCSRIRVQKISITIYKYIIRPFSFWRCETSMSKHLISLLSHFQTLTSSRQVTLSSLLKTIFFFISGYWSDIQQNTNATRCSSDILWWNMSSRQHNTNNCTFFAKPRRKKQLH